MKHPIISSTLALILLTSCSSTQMLPLATQTATSTAIPTSTLTPTLEPWMVSIPEGVVSIEIMEQEIFGLDAQGIQVEKFDTEKNEWQEVEPQVREFATMAEAVDFYTSELVTESGAENWSKYTDTVIKKESDFEEYRNHRRPELPYMHAREQGFVGKVVLAHFTYMEPGINYAFAVTAFSKSDEAALLLCGVDDNDSYKPLCTHVEENGLKLESFVDLKVALQGNMHAFELVETAPFLKKQTLQMWDDLSHPDQHLDDVQYQMFYKQQIEARGENLELFKELVVDYDGGPVHEMTIFDWSKFPKELTGDFKGVGARYVWMFNDTGMEKQYILVSVILR